MFYVTVTDAGRVGTLVGPFPAREHAEEYVTPAARAAYAVDSRAHFYAYGVSRLPAYRAPGKLNARVGYAPGSLTIGP